MKILNPLKMNDWPIISFLRIVLVIQILVVGLILLDSINFQIPMLRSIICFFYLSFIPGILLLRLFRLNELTSTKTILYAAGLSIATLMFTGLFMNIIGPVIGIMPISITPLLIIISLLVLFLCLLCYLTDRGINYESFLELHEITSPPVLLLCLLPFLSIFGVYLMNIYGNNLLQMVLLLIICLMPLIILKWIPEKFYPIVVFSVSLSLLFHTSLISSYIWGADINIEYIYSNLVLTDFYWNSTIHNNVNAMLSIVFLAPIYSIFLNLNLVWVLKIVYPILFSLVPLGLFIIFKKGTSNKVAFLATFFFISTSIFFNTMPSLARQEVAELFAVLLIMLVLEKQISKFPKSILALIFAMSLIVSHYGTAYIFMFIVILAAIIHFFRIDISKFKFENYGNYNNNNVIVGSFMIFFVVLTVAWYMYVSGSSIFENGVNIGTIIMNSVTDIFNPNTSQGAYIIQSDLPLFQSIERYLNIIAQIFIGIGIFILIFGKNRFNQEYKFLSISCFVIATCGIILPFFASTMQSERLYTITLILLAPFFIIGFSSSLKILNKIVNKIMKRNKLVDSKRFLPLISVFLVVFFLFNSAFIYQVFDQPKIGRFALDGNADFMNLNDKELSSAKWLKDVNNPKIKIYADANKRVLLYGIIGNDATEIGSLSIKSGAIFHNSYIFFGTFNIKNHQLLARESWNKVEYIQYPKLESQVSKIYDNGGSNIWISRDEVKW